MENIYNLSDYIIKKKIGEKIKSVRLKQNITQQSLSELTELSLSSVKKIEKGEINSFESFLKVLRILGKLDILEPLVTEEELSPNEYFEMKQAFHKNKRKRARGKKQLQLKSDSEW